MHETNPTEYITRWLPNAPAYLRDDARWRARHATVNADPGDREHYLMELEALVSYQWNPSRSGIDEHDTRLHADLTHEQIEVADWGQIAEALYDAFLIEHEDGGVFYQVHYVPGQDGQYVVNCQSHPDVEPQQVATFHSTPYINSTAFRQELVEQALQAVAAAAREVGNGA